MLGQLRAPAQPQMLKRNKTAQRERDPHSPRILIPVVNPSRPLTLIPVPRDRHLYNSQLYRPWWLSDEMEVLPVRLFSLNNSWTANYGRDWIMNTFKLHRRPKKGSRIVGEGKCLWRTSQRVRTSQRNYRTADDFQEHIVQPITSLPWSGIHRQLNRIRNVCLGVQAVASSGLPSNASFLGLSPPRSDISRIHAARI